MSADQLLAGSDQDPIGGALMGPKRSQSWILLAEPVGPLSPASTEKGLF